MNKLFRIGVQEVRCGYIEVKAKSKRQAVQYIREMGVFCIRELFKENLIEQHWLIGTKKEV